MNSNKDFSKGSFFSIEVFFVCSNNNASALIALIAVQIYWIKSSVKLKEEIKKLPRFFLSISIVANFKFSNSSVDHIVICLLTIP